MKKKSHYHRHLDVCSLCANQPFNLCGVGEKLLVLEAENGLTFFYLAPKKERNE